MVTHMKTTIELPEALYEEARRIAGERGVSLKSLIEAGLRHVIATAQPDGTPFRLRKHPFGGEGLVPELRDAEWSEIRRRLYEGRGG
jgi:hypothetical protein